MSTAQVKIELVGLPGAGKTTLADALAAELARRGIRCVTRTEAQQRVCAVHASHGPSRRWAGYVLHAAREPRALRDARARALRGRPPTPMGLWRAYCLTRHAHNDSLVREMLGPDDLLLLDQDILQEVWGVLYARACPDPRLLRSLLVALRPHLPHVVIHVRVDGRTSLSRMAERRARVGRSVSDLDGMRWLRPHHLDRSGDEAYRIAQACVEIAGARLIDIDGTRSLANQLELAMDGLARAAIVAGATARNGTAGTSSR